MRQPTPPRQHRRSLVSRHRSQRLAPARPHPGSIPEPLHRVPTTLRSTSAGLMSALERRHENNSKIALVWAVSIASPTGCPRRLTAAAYHSSRKAKPTPGQLSAGSTSYRCSPSYFPHGCRRARRCTRRRTRRPPRTPAEAASAARRSALSSVRTSAGLPHEWTLAAEELVVMQRAVGGRPHSTWPSASVPGGREDKRSRRRAELVRVGVVRPATMPGSCHKAIDAVFQHRSLPLVSPWVWLGTYCYNRSLAGHPYKLRPTCSAEFACSLLALSERFVHRCIIPRISSQSHITQRRECPAAHSNCERSHPGIANAI